MKLKNGNVPWGHNIDLSGSWLTWHVYHVRVHLPWKFRVSVTFRSKIWSFLYGFAKGSRGGTWHVPRGTWHRVTNAIVVPALWRIFWCLLRPDRPSRSGAINESPWTDRQTDTHTNSIGPMHISIPSGINLRSSEWTTSILRHYDFELEAICFEPLVSFSYTFRHIWFSFLCNFVLYSFIEAGDVTRRRRCQNRSEEFRKISKFFAPNFFLPKFVYFGIIRPEMMKIIFFGKIKILTPLIFGPP